MRTRCAAVVVLSLLLLAGGVLGATTGVAVEAQPRERVPSAARPHGIGAAPSDRAPVLGVDTTASGEGLRGVTDSGFGPCPLNGGAVYECVLNDPESLIAHGTATPHYGGAEFGNTGDFSFMYVLDYNTHDFGTLYIPTGAFTKIATPTPYGTERWSGLAMDPTTGTMYASSIGGVASSLYTIDLATGAVTRIGAIANCTTAITIAVDDSGKLYALDIGASNLVSVNKATGAGTIVGALDYTASFSQGMDFDQDTNTLYIAAMNTSPVQGELRTCDTSTGATTLVGVLGATVPGATVELTGFGVATTRQPRILVYADDPVHAAPNTYVDKALQALGLTYTAYYDGDVSGFVSSLTGSQWDLVIFAHETYAAGSGVLDALLTYLQGGGRLAAHSWLMGYSPAHGLWAEMGVAFVSYDDHLPDPVYWWKGGHPLFKSPHSVPEFTELQPRGRSWTYGERVARIAGKAIAGYTGSATPNEAALVVAKGGRSVFRGFADLQNDADRDSDGVPDGVELWVNIIASMTVPAQQGIVKANQKWQKVTFDNPFLNRPVVVAGPATRNDKAPGVVRVRRVKKGSFEIKFQEWPYLNGSHKRERISWLAVMPGVWPVGTNKQLVAGTLATKTTEVTKPKTVKFPKSFTKTPVVLAQVQTTNGKRAVTDRICKVTRKKFTMAMQEQEAGRAHPNETIGYVALSKGVEKIGGLYCVAGLAGNKLTHKPYKLVTPRGTCKIFAEEEKSKDSDVKHAREDVGYIAFRGTPLVIADIQTCHEPDTALVRYLKTVSLPAEKLSAEALCELSVAARDGEGEAVPGAVLTSPEATYEPGAVVALEAVASVSDGSRVLAFSHWKLDGAAMAEGQLSIEVEMTGDREALAVYMAVPQ